jgi:hypothetical protein
MKGHFSENWSIVYKGWVNATTPEATIWVFSTTGESDRFYLAGVSFEVPSEGQIDFQTQAQNWGEVMSEATYVNEFSGSITTLFGESDWSNIQTITIDDNSSAATTPSVSSSGDSLFYGLDLVGVAVVLMLAVIVSLIVTVVFLHRRPW